MSRVSNGKVRPDLPRRSELRVVDSAKVEARVEASKAGRDAGGRFATGNGGARNRAWKTPIAKLLGRDVADPTAARVASDAWHLFTAAVRELPSDGPLVRSQAALWAHHSALSSWWAAQAFDRVLGSQESVAAEERARIHGTRAERLAVTMLDLASKLARADGGTRTAPGLKAAVRRLAEMRAHGPAGDEGNDDT